MLPAARGGRSPLPKSPFNRDRTCVTDAVAVVLIVLCLFSTSQAVNVASH
jgi:hypothetical protein